MKYLTMGEQPARVPSAFNKRLMHSHTAARAGGYYCRSPSPLTLAHLMTHATEGTKRDCKCLLVARHLTYGLRAGEFACHKEAGCKSPQPGGSLQDLTLKRHTFSPDSHNKTEITPFRGAINQNLLVMLLCQV